MSNNQLPPNLPPNEPQIPPQLPQQPYQQPIQQGYYQPYNNGYRPPKKKMGAGKIILIILACLIGIGVISSMCSRTDDNDLLSSVNDDSIKQVARENLAKANIKTWEESSEKDEMTDAMTYWASIKSDNTENFNFPYEGGSRLIIWVRKSSKYGNDVYIKITKGQLLSNKYNGTNYVSVRFDDAPAKKYSTVEPSDLSSDQLFLNNAKDFIANAKKAKTIKIEVPVYQEGNRVFIYRLDEPLKWEH